MRALLCVALFAAAWAAACARPLADRSPRVPTIHRAELARAARHDGFVSIAVHVSLADLIEFAQSRLDLRDDEKAAIRARGAQVFESMRDPAPYITPVAGVPDWVLAGNIVYVTEFEERLFIGVGSVANDLNNAVNLAENLARAELSTLIQRWWDKLVPPTDVVNRPSWVAEVPLEVGRVP